MAEAWIMQVELEFPVMEADICHRHPGDAEIDFARRALKRVRPELERFAGQLCADGQIAHYHVISLPRRIP